MALSDSIAITVTDEPLANQIENKAQSVFGRKDKIMLAKTTRKRSLTLVPEVQTKRTSDCLIVTGTISRTGAKLISHFDPQMSLCQALSEFEHLWQTCYDRNGNAIFEDPDPMSDEEALAMGIL